MAATASGPRPPTSVAKEHSATLATVGGSQRVGGPHGSWECQKSKEKKFCKNDRTGDICELECERSKVRRRVRRCWD